MTAVSFVLRCKAIRLALLLSLSSAVWVGPVHAFEPVQTAIDGTQQIATETDVGFRQGNLIGAPIPLSSDVIGNGLIVGGGYLFSLPGSKPSGFGAGYLETNTGSTGYALGGSVNFGQGQWTLGAIYADADLVYDLPIEVPIIGRFDLPLEQSVDGYALRVEYGLTEKVKAGLAYAYAESDIAVAPELFARLPSFLQPDLDIDLHRVTLDVVRDTRDNTFYPRSGTRATADLTVAYVEDSIFDGRIEISSRTYTKGVLSFAAYTGLGADGVVALRGVLCGTDSDAPFFDSCGVGFVDGLRGFSALDNLAEWSASAQVEYRGRFSERFGYALYAGAGAGGDDIGDLSFDRGGFGYGAGLRYRLSKQNQLDYAIDYAFNEDGDGLLYLYVGQRF